MAHYEVSDTLAMMKLPMDRDWHFGMTNAMTELYSPALYLHLYTSQRV